VVSRLCALRLVLINALQRWWLHLPLLCACTPPQAAKKEKEVTKLQIGVKVGCL
jgi:hypothetical protein